MFQSGKYINLDYPRRITGFLQIQTSGAIITPDTRDYEIEGYSGKWTTADDIIIDGQQFFLMEHQQFRRQAAMIVLDSYGKKVIEDCKNGFDRKIKENRDRFYRVCGSKKVADETLCKVISEKTADTVCCRYNEKFFLKTHT